MMWLKEWFKTNLIVVLTVLLVVSILGNGLLTWMWNNAKEENTNLNVQLGIVTAASQAQEVKVVESKVIEEKLKVVTKNKIEYIERFPYDENKSDCDNAAAILSTSF